MNKTGRLAPLILLTLLGSAHAEGIVQRASKDAAKGMLKGAQQELNNPDVTKGAKQMAKGMIDGVSDAMPQMTSQVINQANADKKAMAKVAGTVATQAMAGAVDAGIDQMVHALGRKGDGPLADAMTATTERVIAALVRGAKAETDFKPSPWPFVIGIVIGGLSTVLFSSLLLLLYIAFQRRRPAAPVPAAAPAAPVPAYGPPAPLHAR